MVYKLLITKLLSLHVRLQLLRYFCGMIELAQHIEALLLDNDCVILPGVGGFITHYTPAERRKGTTTLLPPTRIIGFNPQLVINDGLLAQSYMSVYHTGYSDANKRVERSISQLITTLHKEGNVHLPNVGEVHYDAHNAYHFTPYDHRITTPCLYGLDAFDMPLLKEKAAHRLPDAKPADSAKSFVEIKLSRTTLYRAAAVAVIALFIAFLPAPVEERVPMQENRAKLLPTELIDGIDRIGKESLSIQPVVITKPKAAEAATLPTPAAEVPATPVAKPYHLIVASMPTADDAHRLAAALVQEGFADAQALIGNGKMRVGIVSYATRREAYSELATLRLNDRFRNAWVLKQ